MAADNITVEGLLLPVRAVVDLVSIPSYMKFICYHFSLFTQSIFVHFKLTKNELIPLTRSPTTSLSLILCLSLKSSKVPVVKALSKGSVLRTSLRFA